MLAAALTSIVLGYAVHVAARRRRDARLLLISLAFVASAGFLRLHALATPGVLLGMNKGFELATPVGLVVAAAFAAASALELATSPPRSAPIQSSTSCRLAPAGSWFIVPSLAANRNGREEREYEAARDREEVAA